MSRVTGDLFRDYYWQTPAVRHLAWLLTSPSLLANESLAVQPLKPAEVAQKLKALDSHPETLLSRLGERQSHRLGVYFEQLYRFALEHFMDCEVVLQNQQIQENQHTLGELDFIVRRHQDQRVEHHEIAVKFYLGYVPDSEEPDWWGPDSRDRLGRKLHRLLTHQARLCEQATTRTFLQQLDIKQVYPRIFLRGYLFNPVAGQPVPGLPPGTSEQSPRGYWLRQAEAQRHPCPKDRLRVPLRKPDWLGPLQLPGDTQVSGASGDIPISQRTGERAHPQLFADLERTEKGFWLERERFFIVPENWPAL
ncbi:DUF1853 family protein [Mangrovitalea sediminis]|uniref:DUF1853 family protein n=1 Tax=Mangrovitalea sediminis TaxID=1982043 RepID=UPI000BE52B03|nr:DUF1853 family protein [Mangrovitalea sediminis]